MTRYPYRWRWSKWPRPTWRQAGSRKGQRCRVLVRSSRMNSALVEFPDGCRVITSRNGLEEVDPSEPMQTEMFA